MLLKTRSKLTYSLTSIASPEVIDSYMAEWRVGDNHKIFIAARGAAAAFAKRQASTLNEICTDPELCQLGDIAGESVAYAQGFIDAIDYLTRELSSQFRK